MIAKNKTTKHAIRTVTRIGEILLRHTYTKNKAIRGPKKPKKNSKFLKNFSKIFTDPFTRFLRGADVD